MWKTLFYFSLRNILRRKLQTTLLSIMIILSTALLFVGTGIQTGSYRAMEEMYTSVFNGNVQIRNKQYEDAEEYEKIEKTVTGKEASRVQDLVAKSGINASVSERGMNFAIMAANDRNYAVGFVGVDSKNEQKVSKVSNSVVKGSFLDSSREDSIVIGEDLADYLKVKVGDELTVMSADVDGAIIIEAFTITGIFNSGMDDLDKNIVFINLKTFQDLIYYDDQVTNVTVKVSNIDDAPKLYSYLKENLKDDNSIEVLDWIGMMPELKNMQDFDYFMGWMFNGSFILLVAFIILNSMVLSTIKRMKEFGILTSIGVEDGYFNYILGFEIFILSTFAVLIGFALGFGVTYYFHVHGLSFGDMDMEGSPLKFPHVIHASLTDARLYIGLVTVYIFCLISVIPSIIKIRSSKPVEALASV